MSKILLLGHARHGKDTLAGLLQSYYGLSFKSSSELSAEIFIFDKLKNKYGYKSIQQCFDDRVNHRAEWHQLIADYNTPDKARLAKDILKRADMYIGMRSDEEVAECARQKLFDLVIGVFDPRKPLESEESFNMDFWGMCDVVIPNSGSIDDLKQRVIKLAPFIYFLSSSSQKAYDLCCERRKFQTASPKHILD